MRPRGAAALSATELAEDRRSYHAAWKAANPGRVAEYKRRARARYAAGRRAELAAGAPPRSPVYQTQPKGPNP